VGSCSSVAAAARGGRGCAAPAAAAPWQDPCERARLTAGSWGSVPWGARGARGCSCGTLLCGFAVPEGLGNRFPALSLGREQPVAGSGLLRSCQGRGQLWHPQNAPGPQAGSCRAAGLCWGAWLRPALDGAMGPGPGSVSGSSSARFSLPSSLPAFGKRKEGRKGTCIVPCRSSFCVGQSRPSCRRLRRAARPRLERGAAVRAHGAHRLLPILPSDSQGRTSSRR